jgi:hypothetical protein
MIELFIGLLALIFLIRFVQIKSVERSKRKNPNSPLKKEFNIDSNGYLKK